MQKTDTLERKRKTRSGGGSSEKKSPRRAKREPHPCLFPDVEMQKFLKKKFGWIPGFGLLEFWEKQFRVRA